jgi:hypothetical protein
MARSGPPSCLQAVLIDVASGAKRRLLEQFYPVAQAAWNTGSQLVDEIEAGRWPVRSV